MIIFLEYFCTLSFRVKKLAYYGGYPKLIKTERRNLMLTTILAIGGAILVGIGTVASVAGGILQKRKDNEDQKALIDYELHTLGRRDGKKSAYPYVHLSLRPL